MIDSNGNPTPSGTYPGSLHLLHCWRRHPSCVCTCAWCVCIHHGCDTNKKGSSSSILRYTYDGIAIAPSLLACFIDSFMVSLCSVSSLPSLSSPGSVQFSCFITPHLTSLLYFYLYISIYIYENSGGGRTDGCAEPLHVSTPFQIINSVLRVGKPINNINNASISAIKITHLI